MFDDAPKGMIGEIVECEIGRRKIKMRIIDQKWIDEPDRLGFKLSLTRPRGVIFFDGFLKMGSDVVTDVREAAVQMHGLDRSLRGM